MGQEERAAQGTERRLLLVADADERWLAVTVGDDGAAGARETLTSAALRTFVAEEEQQEVRWIIRSAREVYGPLLARGIRLGRTHDLVLCHAILRDTAAVAVPLAGDPAWRPADPTGAELPVRTLFDGFTAVDKQSDDTAAGDSVEGLLAQYRAQRRVIAASADGRLGLLCAAESAGGLVAEEMRAAGLPWDAEAHDRILTAALGPRPLGTALPAKMTELAAEIRALLGDPQAGLDSPRRLLRSLHRIGVFAESTSRWELARHDHPVIAPLLAYKRLARLLTANGWAWLDEWVVARRFRPVYIPGGVVTGRWASAGGGALQLPRSLRPAVRADEGWTLVVADVAQLEPRMLAGIARDERMARAARGTDLYAGVIASGAVATREEAKYAVLGAMYGATTGDSGRLVPRLRRVFPQAMHLVDEAARVGEDGGVVSTLLGRTAPPPDAAWTLLQRTASDADADPALVRRARQQARDRGRFTRNFVVQGTAAEWSLIWLAEIRYRLQSLPEDAHPAPTSAPFDRRAHLAFFLHDEVILHVPAAQAEAAAEAVREAAAAATRRLFGDFPLDVPLDLRIAETAEK